MVKAGDKVVKSVSANKGPKRKGSARKDRLAEEKKASSQTVTKFDSTPSDVIYVGHIPRGFEEREMRKFFAQFGDVQRLKLFRNKKTLASRGHAFVKFDDKETAKVVAETMNGYFLAERQLVSEVVPEGKIHTGMFKRPKRVEVVEGEEDSTTGTKRAQGDSGGAGGNASGLRKKQKRLEALGIKFDVLTAFNVPAVGPNTSSGNAKSSKKVVEAKAEIALDSESEESLEEEEESEGDSEGQSDDDDEEEEGEEDDEEESEEEAPAPRGRKAAPVKAAPVSASKSAPPQAKASPAAKSASKIPRAVSKSPATKANTKPVPVKAAKEPVKAVKAAASTPVRGASKSPMGRRTRSHIKAKP